MGNELSCPCGNRVDIEEPVNRKQDIVETLIKSKLTTEDILYHFLHIDTKACLIKIDQLEKFFNSRQLLNLKPEKDERKEYCSMVYLTNFVPIKDTIFILLRYSGKLELSTPKPRKKNNDYTTNYKIESINLVSNDSENIIEQILCDLKYDFFT
jgi:hypothetical protein